MAKIAVPLLIALLLLVGIPFAAKSQTHLTLEQAGSRSGPNFAPTHLNQQVSVSGVVSARMYHVEDRFLVPIQDAQHHGLILNGSIEQLASLMPGDSLDVTGGIDVRFGMPVLNVASLAKSGAVAPPLPIRLPVDELRSFRTLGVLVTVESFVSSISSSDQGDLATLGDRGTIIRILLPRAHRATGGLSFLGPGDKIRVTGTLVQFDRDPPFDGGYHVILFDESAIAVVEKRTFLPPLLLLSALAATSIMLIIWWIRERRMAIQRRAMRVLHTLSEDIIAAQTPADLAKRLAGVLPQVTAVSAARM